MTTLSHQNIPTAASSDRSTLTTEIRYSLNLQKNQSDHTNNKFKFKKHYHDGEIINELYGWGQNNG